MSQLSGYGSTADADECLHVSVRTKTISLPNDVSTKVQLETLPPQYLSKDPKRPLAFTDENGSTHHYFLKPLIASAIFILCVEVLERFSYYGIAYTQTAYLSGIFEPNWNANLTTVEATSLVSGSTAIQYAAPFIGGILADGFLGDYLAILLGTTFLYIPGLLLIALTAWPHLLGNKFNMSVLKAAVLVLLPLGAGFIKSVVNVFGAKQFHPVLQTSLVHRYYIDFYAMVCLGALAGGIIVPILAQINVGVAYILPVAALTFAVIAFALGSLRYVYAKPKKDALVKTLALTGKRLICKPLDASKISNGGNFEDCFVDGFKQLFAVIPVTILAVPCSMIVASMATVFVVQGASMRNVSFIDASVMINVSPITVVIFGFLIRTFLYPSLEKRGIQLMITHKFAFGTFMSGLAVLSAIIVDYRIHSAFDRNESQISVLWQTPMYVLHGIGELFVLSTVYDAAFSIAPKVQKGFASAINQFFIGSVPSFISVGLYNSCSSWFPVRDGSIHDYASSEVYNYLWVLFGITSAGVVVNSLPPVKNWVEKIHTRAIDNNTSSPDLAANVQKSIGSVDEDVENNDQTAPTIAAIRFETSGDVSE